MPLITKVKISSITNLSDARYCAGMGVQYLGFNFLKNHESYVTPEMYRELTSWISGPEFIGEFEDADLSYIREFLPGVQIDWIEVTRPDNLHELSLLGMPVILKLDLAGYSSLSGLESDLNFAGSMVELFLLEYSRPGALKQDNIFRLAKNYPVLLGFGFNRENIRKMIGDTGIRGIAM
ncbi:MAG: N-(5'-phosphoribosyl)anthranilate isomerase, partial [Cyclobacteriaceae bacterium]|nr:N-(5'-phosphoribosyl)anthranilate isomerase [Cyclobacteriaceae bacterium]